MNIVDEALVGGLVRSLNEATVENAALKQANESLQIEFDRFKIQSLDAFDKQRQRYEQERERADSNLSLWQKINHEHSELLVKNGEQLIENINVKNERDRYKAALDKIASFKEGSEVTGSFDDPVSAKIAREALTPTSEENS